MSTNKISEPLISVGSGVSTITTEGPKTTGNVAKGLTLFSLGITSYSFYTVGVKVAQENWGLNVPELYYYIQFIGLIMFYGLVRW